MRSPNAVLLAILALVAVAPPTAAQSAGTFELGAFGRYTWYDSLFAFDNAFGAGGRLGFFVVNNLALEGDASYTSTNGPGATKVSVIPIHGRLVYNAPLGSGAALLIGAGGTHNIFGKDASSNEDGVGGLLGLRFGRHTVSLRLEGTLDYMPKGDPNRKHFGAQAGLSILLGGRQGPRDRDGDGVLDQADQCPDTPVGDRVNTAGCSLPKDTDGDGVLDTADRCPGTPAGDAVDSSGCSLPKDSDRDGVLDNVDRCPGTPAGDAVDANGCSLPKDSDTDGVLDNFDRCPNTPPGSVVDALGCVPPKDSDGDGVLDSADQCAGTPPGTQVDLKGCQVLFQAGRTALVLQGVNFATGKANLLPASREILDRVAQSLRANEDVRVEIAGYTDSQGSRTTNLRLSQARADAVMAYLIEQGVAASRLVARGYGPDSPVASNATAAGRAQNRRVELHKID